MTLCRQRPHPVRAWPRRGVNSPRDSAARTWTDDSGTPRTAARRYRVERVAPAARCRHTRARCDDENPQAPRRRAAGSSSEARTNTTQSTLERRNHSPSCCCRRSPSRNTSRSSRATIAIDSPSRERAHSTTRAQHALMAAVYAVETPAADDARTRRGARLGEMPDHTHQHTGHRSFGTDSAHTGATRRVKRKRVACGVRQRV